MYADRTSLDGRAVDVQAKYYSLCRTVMPKARRRGFMTNFSMSYCTDHISCFVSLIFSLDDESMYFSPIINLKISMYHILTDFCDFACFVSFVTHLLPLELQLYV